MQYHSLLPTFVQKYINRAHVMIKLTTQTN